MILGPHFGDYQAGFRFGRLGYDLVEKRGLHRFQLVPTCPSGILSFLDEAHPKRTSFGASRFRRGKQNRRLTFAAYSCNNLNTNLSRPGSLGDVQREARTASNSRGRRVLVSLSTSSSTAQAHSDSPGPDAAVLVLQRSEFDESRFEHHLQSDPRLALPECWYWIEAASARLRGPVRCRN